MITKILLSGLGIISLTNCQMQSIKSTPVKPMPPIESSASTPVKAAPVSQKLVNTITLKEGQNIFLKDQQMNITFINIVEDSRCPEGVNCVWAGAATANIELMSTISRPQTIQLSTMDDPAKSLAKTQSFGGFNLSLVSLTPYPKGDATRDKLKGSYVVQISIDEGKPVPPVKNSPATK